MILSMYEHGLTLFGLFEGDAGIFRKRGRKNVIALFRMMIVMKLCFRW